ncbi:hypothetical protein TRVL_07578 [Trypanosoma vivax]|nr:hypothetical protein TRVL_07578 [Trypanosoma vivax]
MPGLAAGGLERGAGPRREVGARGATENQTCEEREQRKVELNTRKWRRAMRRGMNKGIKTGACKESGEICAHREGNRYRGTAQRLVKNAVSKQLCVCGAARRRRDVSRGRWLKTAKRDERLPSDDGA